VTDTNDAKFARQRERFKDSTFLHFLGAELGELSEGRAEVRIPTRPEFANRNGTIHGGVLASLVDGALGQTVRTITGMDARLVTVEFKMNYLAPAKSGVLIGRGEVVKMGGSLATVSVTVLCDEEVVAVGLGTMRVFK
jgi:acyl-CoA thioesterase